MEHGSGHGGVTTMIDNVRWMSAIDEVQYGNEKALVARSTTARSVEKNRLVR
jgi:hypothetical protein